MKIGAGLEAVNSAGRRTQPHCSPSSGSVAAVELANRASLASPWLNRYGASLPGSAALTAMKVMKSEKELEKHKFIPRR